MLRRNAVLLFFTGILLAIVLISQISFSSELISNNKNKEYPQISASLEGTENILITKINREGELNGYGLVNIEDELTIKNLNNNPVNSIFYGLPLSHSEDLVYFEARGRDDNTYSFERNDVVIKDFELITIYFDSPLNPQQSKEVRILHSYKDILDYTQEGNGEQHINFTGHVYPLLPYRAEGSIVAIYEKSDTSSVISKPGWGIEDTAEDTITFNLNAFTPQKTYLDPFLENLDEGKIVQIILSDEDLTRLEFDEVTREVYVSPWGILKVTEEYEIRNKGAISINELFFEIPGPAEDIKVFDDLGEIFGVVVDPEENYYNLTHKDLDIDLSENRVDINPDTKFKFMIQYYLPFEKYFSINWIEESIKIDLLTTTYNYLGRDQTVKIIIEGCYSLKYVSEPPDAIDYTQNSIILIYESNYISPFQEQDIQFTFIINFFDILLRPIIFMVIIALISSAYVLLIKTRKEAEAMIAIQRELLPLNEIREFISLYEEKNALVLEIRQAEEDIKKKKIVKKKYRNILENNTKKIEEIEKEIVPFKTVVRDINATFENLISRMEVLEAERVSVDDSLNLLEARYKRGRLPSRSAYLKLSENFLKRKKRIDKDIDKHIQQLRSYLL